MQLRAYIQILMRFWPLVVALPLIVGIVSFIVAFRTPSSFMGRVDFIVVQSLPIDGALSEPSELRDQWGGTEYLIDDLPQVVSSSLFAQDVTALLQIQGITIDPNVVKASFSINSVHRMVALQAQAPSGELAIALVGAAVEALRQNGLKYWGRTDLANGTGLDVSVLTPPYSALLKDSLRSVVVDTLARAILALIASVGLAFVLHYLDTRLRSRTDVEDALGLPLIGTIPPE